MLNEMNDILHGFRCIEIVVLKFALEKYLPFVLKSIYIDLKVHDLNMFCMN